MMRPFDHDQEETGDAPLTADAAAEAAPAPASPEAPERQLPPGFRADLYLTVNPDVAAAVRDAPDPQAAAAEHFRRYGWPEMRRILPEGVGIEHPASRMMADAGVRADWLIQLRRMAAAEAGGLAALLARHPRAAWLETGFSVLAYARTRPDVVAATASLEEVAFHFLEFGLEEGCSGRPVRWEPEFVAQYYPLPPEALPDETADSVAVLALLRAAAEPRELLLPLVEAEFWMAEGLPGYELAPLFDHEYYHAMASRAGLAPAGFARLDCLRHFFRTGREAGLPFNPDMVFDAAFYRASYVTPKTEPLLAAQLEVGEGLLTVEQENLLYRHWLTAGAVRGFAPNILSWCQKCFGLRVPEALVRQLPIYAAATPKLKAGATPREVLDHLMTSSHPGLAALDLRDGAAQDFVLKLADKSAGRDEDELAEWLYWLVLDADLANPTARQNLADLLQRQERELEAAALRKTVPGSRATAWNVLRLAELYIGLGRLPQAVWQLEDSKAYVQPDVALRRKRQALAERAFRRIWDNLAAHVAAHGVERTQEQLRAVLQACSPPEAAMGAKRSGPIRRVALVGNDDLYQCRLYRVDQKAEQLRAAGFEVTVFSPAMNLAEFVAGLEAFDAVIFFRVAAFPEVIEAIVKATQYGLATFYEVDDLIFDPALFPPSFESYANQISRADHAAIACGVPLFEHAMSLCDYGIASTATIRERMAPRVRSGQVFEHHNALGRLHLRALENHAAQPRKEADAPLVIFYGSGTKAHKEDFHALLEPALAELLRRHPGQIEIRLIGHFDRFRHLDPKSEAVRLMEPVWDFEAYCGLVAEADINLSVLAPSEVTDAKSEIKWMEAAMFGIPSIVSATRTHREVIEDGVTGLLCETAEDFTKALLKLVQEPELRRRIGAAAREKVLAEYAIPAMGANLAAILQAVRPERPAKARLLVVNVFYPPQAIGGATRVVHDNVTLLKEKYGDRFEIDVLCTLEGGRTPYEVSVYSQDGVRVWAISTPSEAEIESNPQDPRMGQVFERLLERIRPDLVHFHCIQRLTAAVVDAARLNRIPYLITAHDGWWISPDQFLLDDKDRSVFYDFAADKRSALPERPQRFSRALLGAEHVLAVSEAFGAIYRACQVPNVRVVENGVSGLPECSRRPSESGRVRLAHIGGASRHKGYHLVRNALLAGGYEHLELLLVDHALAPGVVRQEVWGSTPVTIVAKVPQSDIASLYARIDILLAPSTWPESYGLVAREALASGAWVIASDRGAIGSDVVEGENGFIVDVTTYAGLAAALAKVDREPERYRKAPAVRPVLRQAEAQVDELAALYEEILRARPSGG